MKFFKKKKILGLILGSTLLLGSVVAVAAACSTNNSTTPNTQPNTRPETTPPTTTPPTTTPVEIFNPGLSTQQTVYEGLVSPKVNEIYEKRNLFATTRDSGSLEQQDAAYSFGIAPDLASYKWKEAEIEVIEPFYLRKYYNPEKTQGWAGRVSDATIFTTNRIAGVLASDGAIAKYKKLVSEDGITGLGAVFAQSRGTGPRSKSKFEHQPDILFSPDKNPNLKRDADAHAGDTEFLTNPYDGLIFTGELLDNVYDASKFAPVNNANVLGHTNFQSFKEFATANANAARNSVRAWSNTVTEWKDKKVVVVSTNPQAGSGVVLTSDMTSQDNLFNLSNTFLVPPVWFPTLYGKVGDNFIPGVGAIFPTPTKGTNIMQSYVDDFGWIGGKLLVGEDKTAAAPVATNIGNSFENTADVVIFTYNAYTVKDYQGKSEKDNLITDFENALTNYVNSLTEQTKQSFNPTKILKGKPVVGKNFFINRKDDFYDASFGFLGAKRTVELLNEWIKGKTAPQPKLDFVEFNKDQTQHIRTLKTQK